MESPPQAAWEECLDVIRDNVNRQSFRTWFEPLKAISLEETDGLRKLTVQLPSRFYYEWLEEHYFTLLRRTVTRVLGPEGRLFYEVNLDKEDSRPARRPVQVSARQQVGQSPPARLDNSAPAAIRSPLPGGSPDGAPRRQATATGAAGAQNSGATAAAHPFAIPGIKRVKSDSQLNAAYTFERFIEGDCNRFARSAAWAIAQQPGATSFNPFLIYGGVGLGKTHVIQAIGNFVRATRPNDNVLYVSSERFTTEFVQSIQNNRVGEFSSFYRQIDVLIVDDVQFFGGKEKTQEEFFHIFNTLHQSGKQIILSSDRPPKDIAGIEERLLSRFQWGLSADVQTPELETRTAILQRKAEDDGITVRPEVIDYIAQNVKSNVRELEGSLIRVLAHATLHGRAIDLPLAKEVLRDIIKNARVSLTVEEIQRVVCEYFQVPEDLVRARNRRREAVQARQVAMYFARQLTKHSLKSIGLQFGGRDHSTVIHACQTIADQIDTDVAFKHAIEAIGAKLDLIAR
ncbi:chromosomal replication initiator protein DnaA [soil metagenome]